MIYEISPTWWYSPIKWQRRSVTMRELFEKIADPDTVLALEPEELGGILLFLVRKRFEQDHRRHINPQNEVNHVGYRDPSIGVGGYPEDRVGEIKLAVSEAFAWLAAQGLLVPTIDSSAGPDWKTLSRRARQFESEQDFKNYATARRLNRDLLHPLISEGVWLSFMRGEFPEAVFKAMRAVEIAVREASGLKQSDIGTNLMRNAFGKNGTLRNPDAEAAEADALANLFAGAIGSYKNPHSHRNVPMEEAEEAMEIVMLANHLLRIVDSRRRRASHLAT